MEYQNIINLLDNTPNQLSKFRTKNWIEINYDSHITYAIGQPIRFKTSMMRLSLCDYSNAYIHVKRTIRVPDTTVAGAAANNANRKILFKNSAPFTDCISEINNTPT